MTNITISIDSKDSIAKSIGINSNGKVHAYATNEVAKRMDKYVPKAEGTLKADMTVNKNNVTYNQPYAQKQYYENKGSGLRGSYWDKKMVSAEMDFLAKDVQNYMEGL